jgi:two-component system cell cycle response regulator DivK
MAGEKILMVEDNSMNMELFKDLLEVQGYEVYEATNAQEALGQVKSNEFDLILMDVQLPGMDGLTTAKIIREDPQNKNTPVIALTAYAMKGDEERMKEAGCDGYIAKPIDAKEFPKTVTGFLNAPK